MKETTATLANRIQALEPKLRSIANRFSSDQMDADDIFSEIVEAILTKSQPEHADAMIITRAKWTAYDHVNSMRIYNKYINDEGQTTSTELPEDVDLGDISSSNEINPEDALIAKETAQAFEKSCEKLSPRLGLIVSLLSKGYKPVEIAEKLGVSESAISQNLNAIQEVMATA